MDIFSLCVIRADKSKEMEPTSSYEWRQGATASLMTFSPMMMNRCEQSAPFIGFYFPFISVRLWPLVTHMSRAVTFGCQVSWYVTFNWCTPAVRWPHPVESTKVNGFAHVASTDGPIYSIKRPTFISVQRLASHAGTGVIPARMTHARPSRQTATFAE